MDNSNQREIGYMRSYFSVADVEEYMKQQLDEKWKDKFVRIIDVIWDKCDGSIEFDYMISNDDISTKYDDTPTVRNKIQFEEIMKKYK